MSTNDIKTALVECNTNVLSLENLISLSYMFPLSDTERKDLVSYRGDKSQLSVADKFYLETMSVPRVENRIQLLLFKYQFATTIDFLRLVSPQLSLVRSNRNLPSRRTLSRSPRPVMRSRTALDLETSWRLFGHWATCSTEARVCRPRHSNLTRSQSSVTRRARTAKCPCWIIWLICSTNKSLSCSSLKKRFPTLTPLPNVSSWFRTHLKQVLTRH